MNETINISTDNGKEWKPILVTHDPFHPSRISFDNPKKWTLVDKQGNHMVFVQWEDSKVFIVDVQDGQSDEFEVNENYQLKFEV